METCKDFKDAPKSDVTKNGITKTGIQIFMIHIIYQFVFGASAFIAMMMIFNIPFWSKEHHLFTTIVGGMIALFTLLKGVQGGKEFHFDWSIKESEYNSMKSQLLRNQDVTSIEFMKIQDSNSENLRMVNDLKSQYFDLQLKHETCKKTLDSTSNLLSIKNSLLEKVIDYINKYSILTIFSSLDYLIGHALILDHARKQVVLVAWRTVLSNKFYSFSRMYSIEEFSAEGLMEKVDGDPCILCNAFDENWFVAQQTHSQVNEYHKVIMRHIEFGLPVSDFSDSFFDRYISMDSSYRHYCSQSLPVEDEGSIVLAAEDIEASWN